MKTGRLLFRAAALTAGFAIAGASAGTPVSGWAVVDSGGTLLRGSKSAFAASHSNTGEYSVSFNRAVVHCAFTATIGDGSAGTPAPGYVTVAGENGNPKGVYLAVFDKNGDAADLGFHLNVRC